MKLLTHQSKLISIITSRDCKKLFCFFGYNYEMDFLLAICNPGLFIMLIWKRWLYPICLESVA
jgi:hypothetical protein